MRQVTPVLSRENIWTRLLTAVGANARVNNGRGRDCLCDFNQWCLITIEVVFYHRCDAGMDRNARKRTEDTLAVENS
jgi:hypothetical protein